MKKIKVIQKNKENKKDKRLFLIISSICLSISIVYFLILNIPIKVFPCALITLLFGTIQYDVARLGTLVLTSSLVGLTLIFMILSNMKIRLGYEGLPMFAIVSFISAIFFSIFKLILFSEGKWVCPYGDLNLEGLGHISFIFLILGLISFIIWITINFWNKTLRNLEVLK